MDNFDITSDGYTPDRNQTRRYSPPRPDEPYRPPRDEEEARTFGNYSRDEYRETFEPLDPQEAIRVDTPRTSFKSRQQMPAEVERTASASDSEQQTAATHDSDDARRQSRRRRIEKLRNEADRPAAIVRFFTDDRTRLALAVTLAFISLFMIIAIVSHFAYGASDQSIVENLTISQIAQEGAQVGNLTGNVGAWLSHVLLCDALGLGSLVMVAYLWILVLALFRVYKCNFWGTTFRCLLLAVSASVVLGFFTYNWGTEIYWGGNHGHYVNKFLFDNTTWIGALLVTLLLIAIVCCVYLNELRLVWQKWQNVYRRHKMQEELRKARRHELERLEEEEAKEAAAAAAKPFVVPVDDVPEDDVPVDGTKPVAEDTHAGEIDSIPTSDSTHNVGTTVVDKSGDDTAQTVSSVSSSDDEGVFVIDGMPIAKSGGAGEVDLIIKQTKEIEEADPTVAGPVHEMDGLFDHRAELSHYQFPPIDLLEDRPSGAVIDLEEQRANKMLIETTLLKYKIAISRIEATVGPTVTLYEIVPADGVRISQIKRLEDDIALSLKALGIRIIAPIPGKGTVGIEVPNKDPQTVSMRSVINSKKYQESKMALPMAMGATIDNDIFIADMAKMPHLLVAGATGMGKSVGLNAIIASLLYKKHPSELKLVLIDPKQVEFSLYDKLERHFLAKLPNEEDAIICDMRKVIQTLNSLCVEMDDRYQLLRDANVRSLEEYNRKFTERRLNADNGHRYLPYIVVIVDEFADLIMTQGKEVEQPIARIAQKARAVGIHMILATQRPSTNVITGLIKANFPGRIAFRVIQMVDSRTILDMPGANQLIGRGDMLFSHNGSMERVQCAFISTEEVEALTEFIDKQVGYEHAYYLPEYVPEEAEGGAIAGGSMERDTLFNDAARFVVTRQMGSTSSLQRQFGIGYNRAGKLMDQMEAAGVVGPVNGAKPRAILMDIVTLESILGD